MKLMILAGLFCKIYDGPFHEVHELKTCCCGLNGTYGWNTGAAVKVLACATLNSPEPRFDPANWLTKGWLLATFRTPKTIGKRNAACFPNGRHSIPEER
jgi:hypothetical protein